MTKHNKPIIETIINTSALALTAAGTQMLLTKDVFGCVLILIGAALEFYKYWGRKNAYW